MRATTRRLAIAALVAACSLAGCGGGDEGGGGAGGGTAADKKVADAKKKAEDKKKKEKDAKKKKIKIEAVSFIETLERIVPPDEAPTIRRRLKERDFVADPTGAENRDPFHSFVLPQVGGQTTLASTGTPIAKPTGLCTKKKMVATTYALRDLKLIGIIARGAKRYALFRDAKGTGHMVERGKCVAREKAMVTEIGEGHVTVEIVPDAIPGGPEPVAERRSIPLYPNELGPEELDETEETAAPTETAPVLTPGTTPLAPPPPPPVPPPPSP